MDIENILFGLQIGLQISTAVYFFRIARMTDTPSAPYYIASIASLLMALWRLNKISMIMNDTQVLVLTSIIPVLWLYFAMTIFNLLNLKKKYE